MFYTYRQILHIKQELIELLPELEARGLPVYVEGKHLLEYTKEYDTVLQKIGINGVCYDIDLCRGFEETEKLLNKIAFLLSNK
ncbi:MAG: hypothetical protein HFH69_01445 [Lachnospiraceae bacterium]|nr:hypothetical protein [Lachnospiraceae bacterium]